LENKLPEAPLELFAPVPLIPVGDLGEAKLHLSGALKRAPVGQVPPTPRFHTEKS
jgi:hypothetical protein